MVSESKLSPSESIALKAISGVGLTIFTALMVVHWNHVLSKVQTAKETAPQTATTTTTPPATPSTTTNAAAAPPVASTTGVAPSATSTSAVATNSSPATSSPSTPTTGSTATSSATAPITTTAPESRTTTTSTVTPTGSTTASTSESGTTTTATPVETPSAEPNTLAAVESTSATASNSSSSADVETLKTQLYNTLDQAWTQYPSFSQDLVYKVTVDAEGSIVDYQPIHQAAVDYLNETPLDGASTNSTATGTDFMVIMTPSGILEVNPWIGK